MDLDKFIRSRAGGTVICVDRYFASVAVLGLLLICSASAHAGQKPPAEAKAAQLLAPRRAFPRVTLASGLQLKFDGMISADGKFESKLNRFFDPMRNKTTPMPSTAADTPDAEAMLARQENEIKANAPPQLLENRNEETVQDFQPPEHAVEAPKERSFMGRFADTVVSHVYGANSVLAIPDQVTTDSRQRVIVTDAGTSTVHVLSRKANESFQIVGGPRRRLEFPRSVAVDAADNIYVSDTVRGVVLVYDPTGEFVRDLGRYGDEMLFARPAGIAIDRSAGRLYVADPPMHIVYILDLTGRLVGTIPDKRAASTAAAGSARPGEFQYPQSVLVQNGKLVVLDSTRIQLFDLAGKFLSGFEISNKIDWRAAPLRGLFMDEANHLYLSEPANDVVREYDQSGHAVGIFGSPGVQIGEFNIPKGMCADDSGHVYIVDVHRVQIFRVERR